MSWDHVRSTAGGRALALVVAVGLVVTLSEVPTRRPVRAAEPAPAPAPDVA